VSILSKLFGRETTTKTIKTTASAPYRISKPVAGFFCVTPELQPLMEADKTALGHLFHETRSSTTEITRCHILFLYCTVSADGALPGLQTRIRDLVKAAGACIAIVASENAGDNYMHALNPKNDWPANIVLVVDRRGAVFTTFFQKLFEAMIGGTSMLMAWVELAPQIANHDHPECPVSIMLAEAGHVALNGSA
jgi:hypothetical protein